MPLSTSSSSPLQRVDASSVGFEPTRLGRIREALERDVKAGLIPGAVVGIARKGRLAYLEAVGMRDVAKAQPMWADAVFSIASMTKPMTSVAIMMLHEEGKVLLGDPASKFLPQLKDMKVARSPTSEALELVPARCELTVQDLLRHTSGLTYRDRGAGAAYKTYPGSSVAASVKYGREEFLDLIGKSALLWQPGTVWEYGFSTDILGLIVETVSGQPLGAFLKQRLWRPLAMADTSFELAEHSQSRYAHALPVCPLTGQPLVVHHATGQQTRWQSGGGGAVSTAADYLRFTSMLLGGGALGSTRILGRKTVELMCADHLGPEIQNRITTMDAACNGYGFGLGFAVRKATGVPALAGTAGDYYWSGVYGTYFWVDPKEELTAVFMAAAPGQMRLRYRQLLRGLVLQAIVD
jgi:CubicO group peptidase (beta-lactamase class C family)